MNPTGPGSSVGEHPISNREVAGSAPAQGYLYGIVRKGFAPIVGAVQLGHAITECLRAGDVPVPKNTRISYLEATKEQLAGVATLLTKDGVHHATVLETDGVLAGCITALGLLTTNRDALTPILGELKPWKEEKALALLESVRDELRFALSKWDSNWNDLRSSEEVMIDTMNIIIGRRKP